MTHYWHVKRQIEGTMKKLSLIILCCMFVAFASLSGYGHETEGNSDSGPASNTHEQTETTETTTAETTAESSAIRPSLRSVWLKLFSLLTSVAFSFRLIWRGRCSAAILLLSRTTLLTRKKQCAFLSPWLQGPVCRRNRFQRLQATWGYCKRFQNIILPYQERWYG